MQESGVVRSVKRHEVRALAGDFCRLSQVCEQRREVAGFVCLQGMEDVEEESWLAGWSRMALQGDQMTRGIS